MKRLIIFSIFSIALFSECTKNNSTSAPLSTYAYLEVINLRPDTLPVNIFINQSSITKSSITYPYLINSSPVTTDSFYINVFKSSTVNSMLLQSLLKTTKDSFYALVMGDSLGSFKYVYTPVNTSTLAFNGSIGVRFINAVPNCNYDLMVNNQILYYNKPYFTQDIILHNFAAVDSLKDTVFIYKSGTDSIRGFLPITQNINAGYYTFSVSGVDGDSSYQAVSLQMFKGY